MMNFIFLLICNFRAEARRSLFQLIANLITKNLKGVNRNRVIITRSSYRHDFLINVIDMTYCVLRCIILMREMLIGKNVEYVFLCFINDIHYFINKYMFNLYVEKQ